MPFFKPKPPVDRDEYEWLLACFAWLRTVLDDAHIRPALVLPGDPELISARTAPALFEAVRTSAQMADWPCRLEKVEVQLPDTSPHIRHDSGEVLGTFSIENEEAVIRYSSQMLKDPDALAATFAHELCHYLLVGAGDPPGGPDLLEHATDCAAVYLGFGVLLANSARTFQQWSDGEWSGWQSRPQGYLSENALVTATAMFAALHNYEIDRASAALKPYLRSDLKKAFKAVTTDYPDISQAMESVNLLEWRFS